MAQSQDGDGHDEDSDDVEYRAGPQHMPHFHGAAAEDDGVRRRGDRLVSAAEQAVIARADVFAVKGDRERLVATALATVAVMR